MVGRVERVGKVKRGEKKIGSGFYKRGRGGGGCRTVGASAIMFSGSFWKGAPQRVIAPYAKDSMADKTAPE